EDTTAEAAPVLMLHPLLHSNTSDLTEQRFSSTFSGEEFFLTDHRVRMSDGVVQKLLPGAACLEMARAAIEHALPSYQEAGNLELHNVVWLKPVVVTASKQVSIALFADDDGGIDYELYTIEAEQKILHFQGRARFSPPSAPARHDLDQLRRQMGKGRWEAAEVYSIFARMGLDYGPAHRGITVVNLGEDQVLAQLRLPEVVESSQYKYVLHPSLIDSALQSAIGLIIDLNNIPTTPYLPFGVESLSIRSACTKQMSARVRYSRGSKPGDKIVKFDIDLYDQHDNVCVQMRGFAFRILSGEIFRSGQNGMNLSKTPFDSAFYRNLIARVRSGEVSVDEAVELG
ncbi:MAG: polyketide synthase dehydratase domain-containing protein, partial [Blastocatellia bacterium]|nr:polyketide synthase dehydratase domain-containing protein [Blastocatellia bacterium]